MSPADSIESYLENLASEAEPGDRLPTVRNLMARFGVSQGVVQKATEALKAKGLISAEVGRGTFFVGGTETAERIQHAPSPQPAKAEQRSLLLLRRATSLRRGRAVIERVQSMFQADSGRVVEVSYTDHRDAIAILRTLPRFNACIVQSTFETIPVEMLAALMGKTPNVVIDGAVLSGTEVDAVGLEWGTSVGLAMERLQNLGHQDIGLVVTSRFLLACEMGKIRFRSFADASRQRPIIEVDAWPHQDYERLAVEQIAALRGADGALPVSALIVWGVENGEAFRRLLEEHGLSAPEALSIILLGRTDLASEHVDFFECYGSSTAAQAARLYDTVYRRWANPSAEHRTFYLETETRPGKSVAPIAKSAMRATF